MMMVFGMDKLRKSGALSVLSSLKTGGVSRSRRLKILLVKDSSPLMGTAAAEVEKTLPNPFYNFKVHQSMCMELKKLVDGIARIFPHIEAARPRCSSGIQALCLLSSAIDQAKLLLQYCCESSKLYLALTGDAILLRCQKSKNLLEQSLCQIRTMVPVMLAAEISGIIDNLRATSFVLNSSEKEAGKAFLESLHQDNSVSDSLENIRKRALQLAALRLHITSKRAIVIETRSIRKLLSKVGEKDRNKKLILNYFLHLLKKYGTFITGEQTKEINDRNNGLVGDINSNYSSAYRSYTKLDYLQSGEQDAAAPTGTLSRTLPEKLKCPISGRLMFDPVIIASGETFDRMWVQKWFDEGNVICPKTKVKLTDFSLIPNKVVKDLISEWCLTSGVSIEDTNRQALNSLDVSSTSISSLSSSMNDLHLPLDARDLSFGSLDNNLDSSTKGSDTLQSNVDETSLELLTNLVELPWESQCDVIEGIRSQLQYEGQLCHSVPSEIVTEPLIMFLKEAQKKHDLTAMKSGSNLLLALLSKTRNGMLCLTVDAYSLFTSFLDSEALEEALAILEVLSGYANCRCNFSAAGALVSLLKLLESKSRNFREQVIKILHNVSSDHEICCILVSLGCIPKLVPLINDRKLARFCIMLLNNLCVTEKARVSVAETNGCISSIAGVLENGGLEEQEHAVDVLLSLCSMRVKYCHLVMSEMEKVFPSLIYITSDGSERGKARAWELLRQLREIEFDDGRESFESELETAKEASSFTKEKKSASKKRVILKKILAYMQNLFQRRGDT